MEQFARLCSFTKVGINQGYVFNDGEKYAKDEKTAREYVESLGLVWEEELYKVDTVDEWFYYTEWEEIDEEEFYNNKGEIYTVCTNCEQITPLIDDKYCTICNEKLNPA